MQFGDMFGPGIIADGLHWPGVDGADLYVSAKLIGLDMDYKRQLMVFRQRGSLIRTRYYPALADDQEYSSIRLLRGCSTTTATP